MEEVLNEEPESGAARSDTREEAANDQNLVQTHTNSSKAVEAGAITKSSINSEKCVQPSGKEFINVSFALTVT
jgi:hypothetical protein